jgi:hypothetical protein
VTATWAPTGPGASSASADPDALRTDFWFRNVGTGEEVRLSPSSFDMDEVPVGPRRLRG